MNKALLIGNIANDLEIRKTQTGKSVLSFSVAVNEGYGDKKITDYIDCRAWENIAENIAKYCMKGSKIFVEGKNKTEVYEKDGVKQRAKYVLVSSVEFLNQKPDTHKLTTTPKYDYTQMPLGGGDRDVTGHRDVTIDPDELPFF